MKHKFLILSVLVFLFSCEKEEVTHDVFYSPEINFEVSEWVLKGKNITCVDFDNDGNAWIASGSDLIYYTDGDTQVFSANSAIYDISVAPDGKVWLGTKENGLTCFSNEQFVYFTSENSGLPRDLVFDVEAGPDGLIWFSSSAHNLGGLMRYDGQHFKLFTPDNSPMNQNLVFGLKINSKGDVYFTSEGTVTEAKVFKTNGRGEWEKLGSEVIFYWIAALDLTSKSEPVVATDHSLSSCGGCYANEIAVFRNGKWEVLDRDFDVAFFNRMFVDKRDYVWVQGSVQGDYSGYFVFDGNEWHRSQKGQIPEAFIKSVKVDENNHIWFCTSEGIFILNQ